ncbi:glycoside hydrolase family 38 C-terminal domain-containing protein [Pseudarthrobacter sp. AL07]|uniref:alpha-mannosidase n=1 Tax=unclassified Pseudarthrobacter TaxID=2647000 RepID=UPI00249C765A|nr:MULTISPECIES: glycoside hydrolase family 38 C-terminal domain-containing protein [unclassified Pseudarthrobacter]MDI3195317.1 glycoside hydrolase family 38 C-terminal domain-containing protein [Pseudarthrobacter sp. AL20]MDI3209371.1 glycoside hydrolase family 38 C-terminal domain-containing protein [Pseudarthrobacter sp. AL07]
MHDDRRITEVRLDRFVRERIIPAVYARTVPLNLSSWDAPGEPVPVLDALRNHFEPQEHGAAWGKPWGTKWLRLQGDVPEAWGTGPDTAVEIVVDLGFINEAPGFQCEGIAWRPDGTIIKAISPRNQYIPLKLLGSGMSVDFYVEAAANPDMAQGWTFAATPYGDKATSGTAPQYRLGRIAIAELNQTVWELQQDIWTLAGLMHELSTEQPRRHEILRALERMMDQMDPDDVPGTAGAGRATLAEVLSRPAYASAHQLVATGHAHIDSAWLWPVRETIRKCARTFSNVVALMDEDPGFVFSCSSAQQLAWMKEFYPELFSRIREKVKAGQFVPVGGMWVESDTNMPGGEAMARQFIEGKNFFLDEFGVECREAWLPDSFGYSAALPQIVKSAGSRWFLTQKISWNQVNRMPHHTFNWEGIDGTRLFTHFPPVDTYNAELSGRELAHAERNFRDHGHGNSSLVPFGYGDGGGGPTREMLAAASRTADLEGSPKVRVGSAESFFTQAEEEHSSLPVWVGEMYLELHRGTYTSQAQTKRGNRRSEHLLREAELWCSTAAVRNPGSFEYPAAELKRLWRLVLLQQFHDILPGSSIAWVHQDAERNYAAISASLEILIGKAAAVLLGGGSRTFLLNAAPHARNGVPALAAAELSPAGRPVQATALNGGHVLDNGIIRAVLDADGLLASLTDYATGREAIAPGARGNLLELHRDTPNQWDAWDIDEFYRRNVTALTAAQAIRLEHAGPSAVVVVDRVAGSSPVTQRITLEAGSGSLTITTAVEWQESEKLLKLGFPLDVRADRSASETQFGHVFRPTHVNTSWEAAKFEICAHRWIHVAEPGYGVAISNAATYGHDVTRSVRDSDGGTTTSVRLSLLRAPKFPDPTSDRGPQELTVTIRPGAGIAEAVEEGYRTNLVPRLVKGTHGAEPLFAVDNPALVIEAVKLAEDGSGDVVVRLYESLGQRSAGVLTAHFPVTAVQATDLLERIIESPGVNAAAAEQSVELLLRPFQLVTLRFAR